LHRIRPAEMCGDDPLDAKFGRHQGMDERELVVGLVLAVRTDQDADLFALGHLKRVAKRIAFHKQRAIFALTPSPSR